MDFSSNTFDILTEKLVPISLEGMPIRTTEQINDSEDWINFEDNRHVHSERMPCFDCERMDGDPVKGKREENRKDTEDVISTTLCLHCRRMVCETCYVARHGMSPQNVVLSAVSTYRICQLIEKAPIPEDEIRGYEPTEGRYLIR